MAHFFISIKGWLAIQLHQAYLALDRARLGTAPFKMKIPLYFVICGSCGRIVLMQRNTVCSFSFNSVNSSVLHLITYSSCFLLSVFSSQPFLSEGHGQEIFSSFFFTPNLIHLLLVHFVGLIEKLKIKFQCEHIAGTVSVSCFRIKQSIVEMKHVVSSGFC
jgi:hypothetical protein